MFTVIFPIRSTRKCKITYIYCVFCNQENPITRNLAMDILVFFNQLLELIVNILGWAPPWSIGLSTLGPLNIMSPLLAHPANTVAGRGSSNGAGTNQSLCSLCSRKNLEAPRGPSTGSQEPQPRDPKDLSALKARNLAKARILAAGA